MSLPLRHTDCLDAATAPRVFRAVAQHPLLALLTPSTIDALEVILTCERDLAPAEVGFLREIIGFLDTAEILISRRAA